MVGACVCVLGGIFMRMVGSFNTTYAMLCMLTFGRRIDNGLSSFTFNSTLTTLVHWALHPCIVDHLPPHPPLSVHQGLESAASKWRMAQGCMQKHLQSLHELLRMHGRLYASQEVKAETKDLLLR